MKEIDRLIENSFVWQRFHFNSLVLPEDKYLALFKTNDTISSEPCRIN